LPDNKKKNARRKWFRISFRILKFNKKNRPVSRVLFFFPLTGKNFYHLSCSRLFTGGMTIGLPNSGCSFKHAAGNCIPETYLAFQLPRFTFRLCYHNQP
jgi:hypothetical protein